MAETKPNPSKTSSDYDAMCPYWTKVGAIMAGSDAIRVCGETYLPKFENESRCGYEVRLKSAVLSNIFSDIVETLAAKPFAKEIDVETTSPRIKALLENIDGMGNHIHVVSAAWFDGAVTNAIEWVLVDYTKGVPAGATIAQETAMGARPYWVRIPARNLLAVYTEMIGGVETIVHARVREDTVERDGFDEVCRERVRVLDRELVRGEDGSVVSASDPTWTVYEKRKGVNGVEEWEPIATGAITIGVIPLVPLITGKRCGSSWHIRPPMAPAADLQIEHYQQASAEKHLYNVGAFMMLAANGVSPATDAAGNPLPISTGPMSVVYAPMGDEGKFGNWAVLEPAGTTFDKVSERLERIERQMRELGRQPLTAQSGNITTVTAAFAGDKAMTVVEAWVMNAKDAIENALRLTAMWLKETDEPEVEICTDFLISLKENDGADELGKARERGDLSLETYWDELKRRGILSPNFDDEKEQERLLKESPGDLTPEEIAAMSSDQPSGTQQDGSPDMTGQMDDGGDTMAAA